MRAQRVFPLFISPFVPHFCALPFLPFPPIPPLYLEATEASERYSKDLLQKARAVLRVEADADEGAPKKAYRMRAFSSIQWTTLQHRDIVCVCSTITEFGFSVHCLAGFG